MEKKMRIMSERPLNAETPIPSLRSWITANSVFFDRNQSEIPPENISLEEWRLRIDGEVATPLDITFDQIIRMPKAIVANTLECSGNGRALLDKKATGNPWTIGGVGNAVFGGVWLKDVLKMAQPSPQTKHVAFEGLDKPLGSAGVKFIRSIPLEKAMSSSLLAYEMNGEPLPLKHGYPLRTLALGWTGANCVKWLQRITLMTRPFEGFFMDKVYRVYQKGQDPESGEVVTSLKLKTIITQPLQDETLPAGPITILGATYGGEDEIQSVDVSLDGGRSWKKAEFIGPHERFAWRQWQYIWQIEKEGAYTIMARATDVNGRRQPMKASWNVLGYGNNGVHEHAIAIHIR
jgi:sulfite oxidase